MRRCTTWSIGLMRVTLSINSQCRFSKTTTLAPVIRRAGEGEKRWFFGGGVFTWKLSSANEDIHLWEVDMVEGEHRFLSGKALLQKHPEVAQIVARTVEEEVRKLPSAAQLGELLALAVVETQAVIDAEPEQALAVLEHMQLEQRIAGRDRETFTHTGVAGSIDLDLDHPRALAGVERCDHECVGARSDEQRSGACSSGRRNAIWHASFGSLRAGALEA